MQRVVISRAGGYERLRVESAPPPEPGPGEVRVLVSACGVNYADCVVRMGLYASAKEFVGWPITPGFEFAGVVDAHGPGADAPAIGSRVFGVMRFGAYSGAVCVPQGQLFPIPEGWSDDQAAGFPAVALTAWYAVHRLGHPASGERALVHSAGGGVGTTLLQLLRIAECHVVGVVGGPHKVEHARLHGAHDVIDKSREALWERAGAAAPDGFDLVFDANGYPTLRESWRRLAPEGRLVIYGFHGMLPRSGGRPHPLRLAWGWLRTPRFDPMQITRHNRSVLGFNLSFLFDRVDRLAPAMEQLAGWIAAGSLRPPVVRTFPLAEVAEAHRLLESGETVGKLVLRPEADRATSSISP